MQEDVPQVEVRSQAELLAWLKEHHRDHPPIWLVTYKKAAGEHYFPYGDMVDALLCFGWIDSLTRKLDAKRTMRYLCPRRPGSLWSAVNKAKVAALTEAGLMTEAGLEAIEAAKADGSWSLLDDVDAGIVPEDLMAALRAVEGALDGFEAFPPSAKKGILWWIKSAKTAPTRNKRIRITAEKAGRGERAP